MTILLFRQSLFETLHALLFEKAPRENGCFVRTNSYYRKRELVMIPTEIIKPDSSSWNLESEHSLEPSSSYINTSVVKADYLNSGLIFVHTHPGAFHPPTFSPIDEESNARLFENVSQILTSQPLGSIVLTRKGVNGVAYDKKRIFPFSEIRIVGSTYSKIIANQKPRKISPSDQLFDRQIRAVGKERQATLESMRVGIVGVGGTGSAVAVQLARMGVGSLLLVDRDLVDESNISRVYGTKRKDIGKPKVKVLGKHISTFQKTTVDTIVSDVAATDTLSRLRNTDVIFGCTDNLTSRSILNDLSLAYYIPLIDVGCRIHLDEKGSIEQEIAKVQVVTADNACLWCTGTLDGKVILQESLPVNEQEKLSEEGYYEPIQKQPSVVSLTTLAASVGVNKLIGLLGSFGGRPTSRTQFELKAGFMVDDSPAIRPDCVCSRLRGIAQSQGSRQEPSGAVAEIAQAAHSAKVESLSQ